MSSSDSKQDALVNEWIAEARELGREHGRSAGSWAADGNTTQDHIRTVLRMLEDGDPQTENYLPPHPNLSGEWADSLTPARLVEEITGDEPSRYFDSDTGEDAEILNALCDAYEEGVSETFIDACVTTLRGFLADEEGEQHV